MGREIRRRTAMRLRHGLIVLFLFTTLWLGNVKLLLAQSLVGETTPVLTDPLRKPAAQGDANREASGAVAAQLSLKPPLPFTGPQVGPLIKRAYQDDVERRTTAFLPQSLSNLTPIKLANEKRWIRVDLSEQIVVAYEGKKPVRAFVVSSGLPGTPTVTGEFHIRTKVVEQVMAGGEGSGYYYLPGVKWVQYFYEDYSFHGTYWHNNFGRPMSHGCLNMTNTDAKWLFDWAGPTWDGESTWYKSNEENPGTLVIITK